MPNNAGENDENPNRGNENHEMVIRHGALPGEPLVQSTESDKIQAPVLQTRDHRTVFAHLFSQGQVNEALRHENDQTKRTTSLESTVQYSLRLSAFCKQCPPTSLTLKTLPLYCSKQKQRQGNLRNFLGLNFIHTVRSQHHLTQSSKYHFFKVILS